MASFADAIQPYSDQGGAISFPQRALIEEAGQTFLLGVPVQVNTVSGGGDGGVSIWDGTTLTAGIAGFSNQPGQNLGTTGAGAPVGFSPILGPGSTIGNYAPPGDSAQPLAVITPPMTPISDGATIFNVAAPTTIFIGTIGTSATVLGVATNNNQVGVAYGLTKDTGNNFWYVDTNKTGGNAAVRIVGLYPLDPVGTVGGHVLFVVLNAVAQIFA
jgi:hypothetical protein